MSLVQLTSIGLLVAFVALVLAWVTLRLPPHRPKPQKADDGGKTSGADGAWFGGDGDCGGGDGGGGD